MRPLNESQVLTDAIFAATDKNADGNITHATTVTYAMALLYKNGVSYRYAYTQLSATNYSVNVSSMIYLNGSTDYVELWGLVAATTPRFEGGTAQTYFSGFLARAA